MTLEEIKNISEQSKLILELDTSSSIKNASLQMQFFKLKMPEYLDYLIHQVEEMRGFLEMITELGCDTTGEWTKIYLASDAMIEMKNCLLRLEGKELIPL